MAPLFRISFIFFIFLILESSVLFAQTPKILKLSEISFGTKAIGFSVFRNVEPEPFNVELRNVVDVGGFPLILAYIYGGPLEVPLEEIGAIAGMSGSPIFVGSCFNINECIEKATQEDSDVFLVGALSYALGYFTKGPPNVGLTPAEYMLGSYLGGFLITSQFSIRPPDKLNIDGFEYKNLILFPDYKEDPTKLLQGGLTNNICDESVKGDLKAGSMVTIFIARGSWSIGASGTVTWKDRDRIYVFGHPFFGIGKINFPFVHVSVADTLQTPFEAHKIVGCQLRTEGTMFLDGMFEVAGLIGRKSNDILYRVEIHLSDQAVMVLDERVMESPLASIIITKLPVLWAKRFLGDLSQVSVAYQTRITLSDEPEIFMKNLLPSPVINNPFAEVFEKANSILKKLRNSYFEYNLESVKIHIDFVKNAKIWLPKKSFLSHKTAKPGETVYINIILEELNSKDLRQISIPVHIPNNFGDRILFGNSELISITVQSANNFVEKNFYPDFRSLTDLIKSINDSETRAFNVLYVQQFVPSSKNKQDLNNSILEKSVKPEWSWTEIDRGFLKRIVQFDDQEILLFTTPQLDDFINFDESFTIKINDPNLENKNFNSQKRKNKKWFDYFKPWRWFNKSGNNTAFKITKLI
jgi:hypothetical protein